MTIKTEVDLVTKDGVHIKGDFYDDLQTEKGVVIIPMLGKTKETLAEFAMALHDAGFKSVALDPRGHGKSQLNWQSFTSKDFNNITHDIRAAKDFLSATGAKNIAIVGASIGANLALVYATIDSEVKTVVLLSPGLDFRGVKTTGAAKDNKKPMLVVVSEDDNYSYKSAKEIMNLSTAKDTKLEVYATAGHGTEMFKEKKLTKLLIDWLNKYVK